jgi:hypothetical protein
MLKYKFLLLFYCVSFSYFSFSNNSENINDVIELERDSLKEIVELSKEFSLYSKIGNLLIYEYNDADTIFSVISGGNLSYFPFGCFNTPEIIVHHLNLDFTIKKIFVEEEGFSEIQTIDKLTFKDSFIKIYNNSITESYDIMFSKIIDKEIMLLSDIHIGMSKKDFFNKIFFEDVPFDFEKIEMFVNSDEMGSITQNFIFKDNKLEQIIMDSDYDWGGGSASD